MSVPDPEFLERIRRQFDHCPYPSIPVEDSYQDKPEALYVHNMMTAFYYCRRQVVETAGKLILDAGCGSGFKALALAHANPGAKIVGVDISSESVEFAKKRLQYHGIEDAEFHVLPLEEIEQLGMQFDYINCDEVLYLLPDQVGGLNAMRSVLKPEGILRFNLHSLYGRSMMLRSQKIFQFMGLMEGNPEDDEVNIVKDTFDAMHDHVMLKQLTNWDKVKVSKEAILANHLLVGDRGFSVPEVFEFLRQAQLEFFSMVEWRKWDIFSLFKDPDNLPVFWELALPESTLEDQLTLIELFHPMNRLLDIWCGHPQAEPAGPGIEDWTEDDWAGATVYLQPQLNTAAFRAELERCLAVLNPFEVSRFLPGVGISALVDATIAGTLFLPLLEKPQPVQALVERWQQLHPIEPTTLEPIPFESAFALVQSALTNLEAGSYLFLAR
ncbi:class I SAM-dependent methyltransferase [Spirulina sp. CCNP1310]|uniref:class I SAM-dependent methyltransferase n=1 Tax=Spirulina sp. CCNP1310 TaxID=3110249 RepID=UPI002B1F6F90|nr:class I SAM-dependent methyltransferase [Spirulina sp. CCNP1310]MEA5418663.1 class I SAM-dependent methyltransferase [Spirulina sp. CCNP1310]